MLICFGYIKICIIMSTGMDTLSDRVQEAICKDLALYADANDSWSLEQIVSITTIDLLFTISVFFRQNH